MIIALFFDHLKNFHFYQELDHHEDQPLDNEEMHLIYQLILMILYDNI